MKSKIMSNLMLKIISVIVAFVFWLVIVNLTDPTVSKTFYDIPVQVLNEDSIGSEKNVYAYEIIEGKEVRVVAKGKRSVVENLTEEDFQATADLSKLSVTNAVNIDVKVKGYPTSNLELDWGNEVLQVKLDEVNEEMFKVNVKVEGEPFDGYAVSEIQAEPSIMKVTCVESLLNKIDYIGVTVPLERSSKDLEDVECKPVLYDADGKVLDSSNVQFEQDVVKVTIRIRRKMEMKVQVKKQGNPASGYATEGNPEFKPETISVVSEEVGKVGVGKDKIILPFNISGAKENVTKDYRVKDYLPSGYKLVNEEETITVSQRIVTKE